MRSRVASVGCSGKGVRRAGAARGLRFHPADPDGQRTARQGRPERDELPARQLTEHLGLASFQAQQIRRARHVDVEEGATHEKVGRLRGDVLGELGQPLRGDHARKPALAAAAHQVGHGAERRAPRILRHIARSRRGEELRFIDHHEQREPVGPLGLEKAVEEQGCGPHLAFRIQVFRAKGRRIRGAGARAWR